MKSTSPVLCFSLLFFFLQHQIDLIFLIFFIFNFKTLFLLFLLRYWNFLFKKHNIDIISCSSPCLCALWEKGIKSSANFHGWNLPFIPYHFFLFYKRRKTGEKRERKWSFSFEKMRKWKILFQLTSNEIDFQRLFDYSIKL